MGQAENLAYRTPPMRWPGLDERGLSLYIHLIPLFIYLSGDNEDYDVEHPCRRAG